MSTIPPKISTTLAGNGVSSTRSVSMKKNMMTKIAVYVGITILTIILTAALVLNGAKPQLPDEVPSDFVVLDRTGRPLGPVIGTMQGSRITIVAIPFKDKWLPVEVLRSAFQVGGSFFFMSSDCTGQAFLDPSSSPFLATAIFGPTNEIATGPLSPIAVVLNKKVECSPCLLRECPIDHRCMTRITVDEVYQHASRLLSA